MTMARRPLNTDSLPRPGIDLGDARLRSRSDGHGTHRLGNRGCAPARSVGGGYDDGDLMLDVRLGEFVGGVVRGGDRRALAARSGAALPSVLEGEPCLV